MKQTIKAVERNLTGVFGDDYLFEVPVYQRPYAWTTEQSGELLDDLMNSQKQGSKTPYFLGSIVLIKDESAPLSEVVDGQQRLTTLAIMLCVLRDLADDERQQSNIDVYIRQEGNELKETNDQYRLKLRERDRRFFEDNVQRVGATIQALDIEIATLTDSRQHIINNLKHIHGSLAKLSAEDRWILAKFIAQQCYLVMVMATDTESAYRVFSVLNDRGLDLSPTDILKAETIGQLSDVNMIEYGAKWESVEEELGRESFRDLFTHIRMIRVKSKLRKTLQTDFRDHVLKTMSGIEFVDTLLEPYADVYQIVRDACYESSRDPEQVNHFLRLLGRLDNFDWIPPAMAFFRTHERDHDQLSGFVKDLERLAYGLFIQRANVNERINRYGDVLRSIDRGEDVLCEDAALQLTDNDKSAILGRLNGYVYWETPFVRRVLLERLDSLVADAGATYVRRMISVEHVLPQNPRRDSQWMVWFPREEDRRYWTHRLANLVLLSHRKNSRASNWDFERKKLEYFQRGGVSPFALTSQVILESEWTLAVLERRQDELIDTFAVEWRLY